MIDILDRLSRVVEGHAHSQVFDAVSKMVAAEVNADSCSIFLLEQGSPGLHLRAGFGHLSLGETAKSTAHAAANQAIVMMQPVRVEAPPSYFLAIPMLLGARPLGAVVALALGRPFTAEQQRVLGSMAAHLAIVAGSTPFIEAVQHRGDGGTDTGAASDLEAGRRELVLQGTPASPGIAMGTAVFRRTFPRELARREVSTRGREAERQRVRDGFEKTRNDIRKLQAAAARGLGEDQALIFSAHLMLLDDPLLLTRIDEGIEQGKPAASAIEAAIDELENRLRGMRNAYIQERVEDLEDICSRLLGHVMFEKSPSSLLAQVVLSPGLAPSLVMEIKTRGGTGILAEGGGTTSHGALLARSLGVPAVTGVPDALRSIMPGDEVIMDGTTGRVIARPTSESLTWYKQRAEDIERHRTEFLRYRDRIAESADGKRIRLQANVALGVDIALAKENRAEGIGLYRTEFPFIVREGFPTREEQIEIYRKAYDAFPRGPVTFRLLDMAADKFVPTTGIESHANAFHGYRSIRVLFDYPDLLRIQVQAFAIAAGHRPLRILIPMVSSLEDVYRIKGMVANAIEELRGRDVQRQPEIGAMIEVPAAVELVPELAVEVQFFSLGTNDLIQYALVIDRDDSRLSSLRDAYHPAILRMIRRTVTEAHRAGKEVSVCGEMAARPDLAAFLIALGVKALSVNPRIIPELKQALAAIDLEALIEKADEIIACRSATEAELAIRGCIASGRRPGGIAI